MAFTIRNNPQEHAQASAVTTADNTPAFPQRFVSAIKRNIRLVLSFGAFGTASAAGFSHVAHENEREKQAEFDARFDEHMQVALKDLVERIKRANFELYVLPDIEEEYFKGIGLTEGDAMVQLALHRPVAEPFSNKVNIEPVTQTGDWHRQRLAQIGSSGLHITPDGNTLLFEIDNNSYWSQTERGTVANDSKEVTWAPFGLMVHTDFDVVNRTVIVNAINLVVEQKQGHFVQLEYSKIPAGVVEELTAQIPLFYESLRGYAQWAKPLQQLQAETASEDETFLARMERYNEDFSAKIKQGTLDLSFSHKGQSFSCTGFIVAQDAFVTARHCILNKDDSERKLVKIREFEYDGTDKLPVSEVFGDLDIPTYGSATFHPQDISEDIALVSFDGFKLFAAHRTLPISMVPLTNGVYLTGAFVGYGEKQRWEVKAGEIDPETQFFTIKYNFTNQDGNSGGPIVDRFGNVVGLHSLGDDKKSYAPVITEMKIAVLKAEADRVAKEREQNKAN